MSHEILEVCFKLLKYFREIVGNFWDGFKKNFCENSGKILVKELEKNVTNRFKKFFR